MLCKWAAPASSFASPSWSSDLTWGGFVGPSSKKLVSDVYAKQYSGCPARRSTVNFVELVMRLLDELHVQLVCRCQSQHLRQRSYRLAHKMHSAFDRFAHQQTYYSSCASVPQCKQNGSAALIKWAAERPRCEEGVLQKGDLVPPHVLQPRVVTCRALARPTLDRVSPTPKQLKSQPMQIGMPAMNWQCCFWIPIFSHGWQSAILFIAHVLWQSRTDSENALKASAARRVQFIPRFTASNSPKHALTTLRSLPMPREATHSFKGAAMAMQACAACNARNARNARADGERAGRACEP